jgi:hypothetical protein
MKILVVNIADLTKSWWTLDQVLAEINRDHSDEWTDYDESDWLEGWNEWVEGEFYHIVTVLTN